MENIYDHCNHRGDRGGSSLLLLILVAANLFSHAKATSLVINNSIILGDTTLAVAEPSEATSVLSFTEDIDGALHPQLPSTNDDKLGVVTTNLNTTNAVTDKKLTIQDISQAYLSANTNTPIIFTAAVSEALNAENASSNNQILINNSTLAAAFDDANTKSYANHNAIIGALHYAGGGLTNNAAYINQSGETSSDTNVNCVLQVVGGKVVTSDIQNNINILNNLVVINHITAYKRLFISGALGYHVFSETNEAYNITDIVSTLNSGPSNAASIYLISDNKAQLNFITSNEAQFVACAGSFLVDDYNSMIAQTDIILTDNELTLNNQSKDLSSAMLFGAYTNTLINQLSNNTLTINDGVYNNLTACAAFSRLINKEANDNTLIVTSGEFSGTNIVWLAGAQITQVCNDNNTISGNGVIIKGGTFSQDVTIVAARHVNSILQDFNPIMDNNYIKLIGDADTLNLSGATLIGVLHEEYNAAASAALAYLLEANNDFDPLFPVAAVNSSVFPENASNNKLIVATNNVTAKNILYFNEFNFILPKRLSSQSPMLKILSGVHLNPDNREVHVTVDAATNDTKYHKGDQIILLSSDVTISGFNENTFVDDSNNFTLKVIDNNKLVLEALTANIFVDPALDAGVRSLAASAISVNSAMDLVASSVANHLTSGNATNNLIAASVGSSKVTTGSYVKSFGGSLALGFSRGYEKTQIGMFIEGGLSHFDSYEIAKIGYGNSKLFGLGAILKFDTKAAYLTTMVHGGMLKTNATFKANNSYLGGFAELGWHLGKYLDFYTRYSYSRTSSVEEELNDKQYNFDPTESHRARAGIKVMLSERLTKPYLGLAFEREFKGETKGVTVDSDDVAAPTTKGNTGIIELGAEIALSKNFLTRINFETSFGRRQGVSGSVGMEFRL